MATTFTTDVGWFDILANQEALLDEDYKKGIDIDDLQAKSWRASRYLMSVESKSMETQSPRFYVWRNTLQDRVYTVNEAVTTGELDITLDSTTGLIAGLSVRAIPAGTATSSGRHMRIASVDSSTVITVTNVAGAGTLSDGDDLVVLANATLEDAATGAVPSFVLPETVTNRTQTIQRRVKFTKDELATRMRGLPIVQQKHQQGRAEYEKDIDFAFLASAVAVDTTNDFQITRGIIPTILGAASATKVNAGNDELTYQDITALLEGSIMEFRTTDKLWGLCGTQAVTQMAELGASAATYRTASKDNEYGFRGMSFVVGNIEVMLAFEKAMKEMGGHVNKMLLVLDPGDLMVRHLPGLKFEHKALYRETEGSQLLFSHWESHCGLQMTWEKRHGLIHSLAA